MQILNFFETLYPFLGTLLAGFFVLLFISYLMVRTFTDSAKLKKVLAKTIAQEKSERDYWRIFKYSAKKRIIRRSGQRCEWFDPEGERCELTSDLEIDHIQPWSAGGWTIESNAQVLCHGHHLYKGGSVPTEEEIKEIETRRREYFPRDVDATIRWKPTDEERELHKGKTF